MILAPQKIRLIKVSEISPNPYQTRRNFNGKSLEKLAQSIKEVGMLSPLLVRSVKNGYELICGQRRLRAAAILGMETVPAVVVRAGDRQCAQLSLIENIQRENMALFEEAEGYYNLLCYHRVKKEEITSKLAIDTERINEKIRLLSLQGSVRYKIEENIISEEIARELIKLHDEKKQLEIINIIKERELNRKETSELVKESLKQMREGKEGRKKPANIPLCINTVKKTTELLKKSGAKVDLNQFETENYIEFKIKISK